MTAKKVNIFKFLRIFVKNGTNCNQVRYLLTGSKMSAAEQPDFLIEKQRYLNMPSGEKRASIKNVTTLDQVVTWDGYFRNNTERLRNLDKNSLKHRYGIANYNKDSDLNSKVALWKGDITKLEIDSIVNAANNSLLGGGGVDGAIHRGAGEYLLKECRTLNGCETGDAKITGGYKLPAKYIIHTVGPRGEKPGLLESCYRTCLERMLQNQLRSIAFPCISTGVYGYPQESAANVALTTIRKFLEQNSSSVDKILFCLFLEKDVEIYETMMQLFFPVE